MVSNNLFRSYWSLEADDVFGVSLMSYL